MQLRSMSKYNSTEKHLERLIVAQLVKKFPAFYGARRFIAVFTRPANGSILSNMNPVHTLQILLPKNHFIFFSHPPLCLPSGLFPSGFPTKILNTFIISTS
jgi:hypothetical protein